MADSSVPAPSILGQLGRVQSGRHPPAQVRWDPDLPGQVRQGPDLAAVLTGILRALEPAKHPDVEADRTVAML